MKLKFMFCLAVLLLAVAGCQNSDQGSVDQNLSEEAFVQEMPSEKGGFQLSVEQNEYTPSAKTITAIATNKSDEKVESNQAIFIEKNVDGVWYQFPYTEPHFEEMLRFLPPGESHTFDIQVSELENELTPGNYRVVHEELAAPFEVAE